MQSTPVGRYGVGSVIEYRAFGGEVRRVKVEWAGDNVKDGRPGFDGKIVGGSKAGEFVWGYDEQITRVVA